MSLIFPSDDQTFRTIRNTEDLRLKIYQESKQRFGGARIFKISLLKNKYIYAICGKCNCKIIYKKDGEIFRLTQFINIHNHQLYQISPALSYLRSLPSQMSISSSKTLMKQSFNINDNQFYYLRKKCLKLSNQTKTLTDLLEYFQNNNYFYNIGKKDQKGYPEHIFVISEQMKQIYGNCGFNIKIDYTFSVFKDSYFFKNQEQGSVQEQSYQLGIISGINKRSKIVVFGIAITPGQKKVYIKKYLQWFFSQMRSDCDSITSDMGKGIRGAVDELVEQNIFEGILTFDLYHFFKLLKLDGKDKWNIIKLLSTAQQQQYEDLIEKLSTLVKTDDQIRQFKKIRQFQDQLFLSKIPKDNFVGLSSQSSSLEKLNDLLKKDIPLAVHLYEGIFRILEFCHRRNQISESSFEIQLTPLEQYFNIEGLSYIRNHIARQPFNRIVQSLGKSLNYNMEIVNSTQRIVKSRRKNYKVQYKENEMKWSCQCNFFSKSFLPCSHQLRCSTQIKNQVGQFWMIKDDQITFCKEKRQFTRRKTRRNRIK